MSAVAAVWVVGVGVGVVDVDVDAANAVSGSCLGAACQSNKGSCKGEEELGAPFRSIGLFGCFRVAVVYSRSRALTVRKGKGGRESRP